ncbi:MAG: Lrp/AsnC family transcriptional regulator [Sphingobium sp.]
MIEEARDMKNLHHCDEVDRRIMGVLQVDASISHNELAQTVGASTASCWRRIKALERAGILTRSIRLINPAMIGLGVNVLCNIRMRSHAPEHRKAFEDFVNERPEIIESFSMSGEWDYLLRIVVADVAEYNLFLMDVLLAQATVAGAASHFALSMTKYTTAIPL